MRTYPPPAASGGADASTASTSTFSPNNVIQAGSIGPSKDVQELTPHELQHRALVIQQERIRQSQLLHQRKHPQEYNAWKGLVEAGTVVKSPTKGPYAHHLHASQAVNQFPGPHQHHLPNSVRSLPGSATGSRQGHGTPPPGHSSQYAVPGVKYPTQWSWQKPPAPPPLPATPEDLRLKISERLDAALRHDQNRVLCPDFHTPFASLADALARLLPYHVYYEPDSDEEARCTKHSPNGNQTAPKISETAVPSVTERESAAHELASRSQKLYAEYLRRRIAELPEELDPHVILAESLLAEDALPSLTTLLPNTDDEMVVDETLAPTTSPIISLPITNIEQDSSKHAEIPETQSQDEEQQLPDHSIPKTTPSEEGKTRSLVDSEAMALEAMAMLAAGNGTGGVT